MEEGKMQILRYLGAAAAAFLVMISAGNVSAAQHETIDVTMILFTEPGIPFWLPVIKGAEEAAAEKGVVLDIQYADGDPVKQNNIIEAAIANKIDGIALVNWIPDAFTKNIALARAAGIGVVVFDTDDPNPDATESQGFYGASFYKAGKSVANYMVSSVGLKSGDHVLVGVEFPDAFYGIERYRGIKEVFDGLGITSERIDTTPTTDTALTRLAQYLVGHPETDGVIGLGEIATSVAPKAVAEAGMDIPAAGFSLTTGIVNDIIAGRLIGIVDSAAFYEGYLPIINLYYFVKYGLPPTSVELGGGVVDQSNVDKVKDWVGIYW